MRTHELKLIALSVGLLACGDASGPRLLPDAPTFDATPQFTLTVTRDGNGNGAVTSSPSGIDCGGDCSRRYDAGTTVTLTATAATGTTFLGWNGGDCTGTGPCTLTLNEDTTVGASFALDNTIVVTPADATFNAGTTVTLTPSTPPGNILDSWSGDCQGTGPCVITLTRDVSVTATFRGT